MGLHNRTGSLDLRPPRVRICLVVRGDGAACFRCRIRLGHRQTAKCIGELVALVRPEGDGGLFAAVDTPPVTITCKPGDSLDHVADASIDVVVMDWPINTEAEGSMHIRNKAAANSTVFLVCRPRTGHAGDGATRYWEEVEPAVAAAVRERVEEFQQAGISGVDFYLACFGPALKEFFSHWPLARGTPRPVQPARRRSRQAVLEEDADPYAATPEDALDAARREVKRWRLEQLTHVDADTDLDPATAFFVLAWDTFRASAFSYDEALQLGRAVGVDVERDVVGRLAEKKGSDLLLWDSSGAPRRAHSGSPAARAA